MSMYLICREEAEIAVTKLKIFAQPQRLKILNILLSGEHSVTEIAELSDIGQPALSQQLAALRRGQMVRTRRQSKQVYYSLFDEVVEARVRGISISLFGSIEQNLAETSQSKAMNGGGSAHFVKIF